MTNEKILVTGLTGQVGNPIARALAEKNEVWGAARFSDSASRQRIEGYGVRCATVDFATGDFADLPDDFGYVLHFAVSKTHDFDSDLRANAEGTGLLMHHVRNAKAFLHCSSSAVYEPKGHEALAETDRLGDNHKPFGFLPTYSICKIATEGVARLSARLWNLPTTIARLNVPYGDFGGWPAFHLELMLMGQTIPVHVDAPSVYNPIHSDDIIDQIPRLLEVASVPATIVNWAGKERVSIEDWCSYLGELTGIEPKLEPTEHTIESAIMDTTRMRDLIGESTVPWKDGFHRMVEARHPELLRGRD
ncbi:MAG: NAD-dependent epimerase/dehydratase family protein [Candidatus Krumholzibacteriia bacterium]